jgi:DNA replication licensing factor MCM5
MKWCRMKLQESPESVPTGEMPRQLLLSLDRYLVGAVKPGTRVTVIGVYTTLETKAASQEGARGVKDVGIRLPYLRALGIQQENEATDLLLGKFTPEDEEEMHQISQLPDLYERISSSIAPAIFGSEDIKRALACQLFGGARKHLPDSMRLRGDINVLLLGDPSVAKSQFLKFIVQVAPIGVYTSGKGNSAAGLTVWITTLALPPPLFHCQLFDSFYVAWV